MKNCVTYLTQDHPGIGGKIKVQPEDFIVEEIPLYSPSGEGTHTYFAVRKRDLTTMEAIRRIARTLDVPSQSIGYAGLKDAKAITTQTMSIEHIPPEHLLNLESSNIEILWAERHRNKLRVGHLKGNRFEITIRDVRTGALSIAQQALAHLKAKGIPNRFGDQRFGIKGDSHLVGKAFLRQDWETALDFFLGRPDDKETAQLRQARTAYDAGELQRSYDYFPSGTHANERRVLKALMQQPADLERACLAIPKRLRKLFLSAYQARLFNRVLEARLPNLDQLYVGDLAMKHSNGAVFTVEDTHAEQPRADAFEISPSGPIYGYKMSLPRDKAGKVEAQVLETEGLGLDAFRIPSRVKLEGARRALRVPIESPHVETVDVGLRVSFALPPGAYATVVLEELMKGRTWSI